ncbi:MAG TPA: DUF1361 domain-containing protein [Candidatus Saccharimonadales bacterium]|jgi:uncharacterized membrane protein|nr:DUF1361 domain-containing protein [Candidatus Saccharimonadales bacterium]
MKWYISTRVRLGLALGAASIVSLTLWGIAALRNHSLDFAYLSWNLFLAWVPLVLMLWLEKVLRRKVWSSWQALLITVAFVSFLPNTFYLTTDVIHLQEVPRVDLVFDVIVFMSFILNAFLLGLIGVYMFHVELRKRLSIAKSWSLLSALILLVSFAIYIGRDLRWNTWDILLNPASILFEVSDRLLAPTQHPELFSTTIGFFVFITSIYVVAWYVARVLRQQKQSD